VQRTGYLLGGEKEQTKKGEHQLPHLQSRLRGGKRVKTPIPKKNPVPAQREKAKKKNDPGGGGTRKKNAGRGFSDRQAAKDTSPKGLMGSVTRGKEGIIVGREVRHQCPGDWKPGLDYGG